MKQAQLQALISQSIPFVIGEFRGYSLEVVPYVSKKDGKQMTFQFFQLSMETKSEQATAFRVGWDLPKGATVNQNQITKTWEAFNADGTPFQWPFKKGDTVVILIHELENVDRQQKIKARTVEILEK